ncbi:hypothetical protein J2858_004801 [Neorhizobium galegae]|uniref:hypothetical protein n=1 Tax=Neorhizobium galegae TaxID=399 RepID=UPI001AE58B7F|nr:hypothetical protein [Neorhizobium galegae]MBP2551858.1 hypothetical protein [Neorhizobium galegae]
MLTPLLRQHITLDGSRACQSQPHQFLDVIEGKADSIFSARDGMLTTILAITKAGQEGRDQVSDADVTVRPLSEQWLLTCH